MAEQTRGSQKVLEQLFGDTSMSAERLAGAVEQASAAGLRFDRLWWKGQPHPDLIWGITSVKPVDFAATIMDLLRLNSSANQLSFKAFPKGLPQLEAVDLEITVNRNLRG